MARGARSRQSLIVKDVDRQTYSRDRARNSKVTRVQPPQPDCYRDAGDERLIEGR